MNGITTWSDVDVSVRLHAELGEGPLWDHRVGRLVWVDILAGLVHSTESDSGVTTTVPVGTVVGAVGLAGEDGYLLATRTGFAGFDGTEITGSEDVIDDPGQRMNDGAVDPAGRFVAGSITGDRSPTGALFSREPDGTVTTLLHGVTVSNGLAWSSDGTRLFYVDSARQSIDVMDYDVETGAVSDRRTWVEIPESRGTPDGLTIDAEGCLWLALFGGESVLRFSPAGRHIGTVELPVARVTSCAFGGPDLDRLYITTAGVGWSEEVPPRPLDGALFVVEPGAVGVAETIVGEVT